MLICGTLDCLPSSFAELDAEKRQGHLRNTSSPEPARMLVPVRSATSSLPYEDRRLVRCEGPCSIKSITPPTAASPKPCFKHRR